MQRLSGLDASFLYLETPTMHMHVALVAVLDPAQMPGGYDYERVYRFIDQGVRTQPQLTASPGRSADQDRPPDVARRAELRHLPPRATHRLSGARQRRAARRAGRSHHEHAARPRAPTLGGLGHRGPRGRSLCAGRQGAPRHHRRHRRHTDLVGAVQRVAAAEPKPRRPSPRGADESRCPPRSTCCATRCSRASRGPRRSCACSSAPPTPSRTCTSAARAPSTSRVATMFDSPRTRWNGPLSRPARDRLRARAAGRASRPFARPSAPAPTRWCWPSARAPCAAYLEARGELPLAPLIAACPIATRVRGQTGNRVSAMVTSLATNLESPVERLREIRAVTRSAKQEHDALGGDLMRSWAELATPGSGHHGGTRCTPSTGSPSCTVRSST